MIKEDYRNIPTDYVIKRTFAWLLVFVGWVGIFVGGFIHFFGVEQGLFLGLQLLVFPYITDIRALENATRLRVVVGLCLAIAVLTGVGAFRLHQYYLLFGASLLVGLSILFTVKRHKNASPAPAINDSQAWKP